MNQQYAFETIGPIDLVVEIGSGNVTVETREATGTDIEIRGNRADEVEVTQQGDHISVIAPRTGLSLRNNELFVTVACPAGSAPSIRTGSADIMLGGRYGTAALKTGSGDVRIDTLTAESSVETGSGDVDLRDHRGELRVKCGSGDVRIGESDGGMVAATGSGDVKVGHAVAALAIKTGSGDVEVAEAESDVSLSCGSGDLRIDRINRGRVTLKGASSDARIGVPAGTPVWTDISTLSGDFDNHLPATGAPAEGQDYVEIRIKTVSGDVALGPA